ncbi:hypothetical protein FA95DRAFT_1576566 [Auriscalpium vulgare]|uniref:Uncharacterized protein n=1 Tax=Auriscalpium vulgare TaxID=40419 RepID=A0ACB8RB19_9AGAM|nr:hypothetical protein FA95DRAFT_1576566 [Auriscalpium vulgare]
MDASKDKEIVDDMASVLDDVASALATLKQAPTAISLTAGRLQEACSIQFLAGDICEIQTTTSCKWKLSIPGIITEVANAMATVPALFARLRNLELNGCTLWGGPSDFLVTLHQMQLLESLLMAETTFRVEDFDLPRVFPRVIMGHLKTINLADSWNMMDWLLKHLETPNLTHQIISIHLRLDCVNDPNFQLFLMAVHDRLAVGVDMLPCVKVFAEQDECNTDHPTSIGHRCIIHLLASGELKGAKTTVKTRLVWDVAATELEGNKLRFVHMLAVVLGAYTANSRRKLQVSNINIDSSINFEVPADEVPGIYMDNSTI